MGDGDDSVHGHVSSSPVDVEAIYLQHRILIQNVARKTLRAVGTVSVDDVVSDVVLAMVEQIAKPTFDRNMNWAGWLTRVTTNAALKHLEKSDVRERASKDQASRHAATDGRDPVGDAVVNEDEGQRLREAINRLPERDREIVKRVMLKNHSRAAVGRGLGISERQVGNRLNNALHQLKDWMGGER